MIAMIEIRLGFSLCPSESSLAFGLLGTLAPSR